MGIFDTIFNGGQQQQQQPTPAPAPAQPAQAAPQQPVADTGAGNPGNIPSTPTVNVDPANATAPVPDPTQATAEESPLAQFASLWDTTDTPSQQNAEEGLLNLNQEEVQKVIAKADFTSVVTPEQLQAISSGGEDAQTAFMQALGSVAQRVMLQSTLVNGRLSEQAVRKALSQAESRLPDTIRKYGAADHAKNSNPVLNNPAVKPVADAVQAQLLLKNPNATNAEITQMTQDFIVALGAQVAPAPVINNNEVTDDIDWDAFLNS